MDEDLSTLLAMRHASGPCRGALATELYAGTSIGVLAKEPRWAPKRADVEAAERQLTALFALGITVIPQWRLPSRLRRTAPLALFVRGSDQSDTTCIRPAHAAGLL